MESTTNKKVRDAATQAFHSIGQKELTKLGVKKKIILDTGPVQNNLHTKMANSAGFACGVNLELFFCIYYWIYIICNGRCLSTSIGSSMLMTFEQHTRAHGKVKVWKTQTV